MFDCGLFFLYRIWHIHNLALAAVVLLAHKNQLQLEETQVDSPLNQYQLIVNPNKEKMVRLSVTPQNPGVR